MSQQKLAVLGTNGEVERRFVWQTRAHPVHKGRVLRKCQISQWTRHRLWKIKKIEFDALQISVWKVDKSHEELPAGWGSYFTAHINKLEAEIVASSE